MEERYRASFLKAISGSSDDFEITKEFSRHIHEYSRSFNLLDKAASFFYLFDFVRMRYVYVSESIKHIMGYTSQEWVEGGPDWVFTTIYPEDVARLKDLHRALFDFYYAIPVADRVDYKYVWEVRVIRKDRAVIWIMQQGSFIEIDKEGKPIITFDILTDITKFKKDKCMTLNMFKNEESKKTTLYFPIHGKAPFSKREIEIIPHLSKGLSSKEIAQKLFISPHTVDTHRRNMLKKSGVKDSASLLNFARDNGLI